VTYTAAAALSAWLGAAALAASIGAAVLGALVLYSQRRAADRLHAALLAAAADQAARTEALRAMVSAQRDDHLARMAAEARRLRHRIDLAAGIEPSDDAQLLDTEIETIHAAPPPAPWAGRRPRQ